MIHRDPPNTDRPRQTDPFVRSDCGAFQLTNKCETDGSKRSEDIVFGDQRLHRFGSQEDASQKQKCENRSQTHDFRIEEFELAGSKNLSWALGKVGACRVTTKKGKQKSMHWQRVGFETSTNEMSE